MSIQTPAQQIFDLLVSKDYDPQTLTKAGMPAESPADAEVISFDYRGASGADYGTVVVMLGEDNNMTMYFGDNLGKSMEGDDKQGWFDFLYQMRMLAKRNLLGFQLENLTRLKHSMTGQTAIKEGLFESWAGTKTTSWNGVQTEARLMIKHARNLGENDARYRYIAGLFVETADGERFKLPFTKLSGGRAMLEHVRQGGKPYDARGQHITEMVNEINLLAQFRRASQGRVLEGQAAGLAEAADGYYRQLQKNIKSLASGRGYASYFESWSASECANADLIIEDLRTMFTEVALDRRIEQALPILSKLNKQGNAMKEVNVFESWMKLISEGTWSLPDTPESQAKLVALMSKELPVGPDAINSTEQLYDILGDDELFDRLIELSRENADADARAVILDRLEELRHDPSVAQVIGQLKVQPTGSEQGVSEGSYDYVKRGKELDAATKRIQSNLDRRIKKLEQGAAEGDAPVDHDWYRKQQERQTRAKQKQQGMAEGSEQRWRVTVGNKSGTLSHTKVFTGTKEQAIKQAVTRFATTRNPVVTAELVKQDVAEASLAQMRAEFAKDGPGQQYKDGWMGFIKGKPATPLCHSAERAKLELPRDVPTTWMEVKRVRVPVKESISKMEEGSGYDGSEPLDLSKNPSVNDVFKRALYIYDFEGYGNNMDYSEDDAIDQYVAKNFGLDVLDQLTNARTQSYFGRADGKGPGGGGRTSNLGTSSAPGGNFRTTKAGVMNKQDAKTMKGQIANRLGSHPEPVLPEGSFNPDGSYNTSDDEANEFDQSQPVDESNIGLSRIKALTGFLLR